MIARSSPSAAHIVTHNAALAAQMDCIVELHEGQLAGAKMNAWRDQPELAGRLVRLRPMAADDAPLIAVAAADGNLWELFYTLVPAPGDEQVYVDRALAEKAAGRAMPFIVIDAADSRAIGSTRFMRMNEKNRRLEIGTTFYAKSAQRSGINTEAKLLLLCHAFEVLECNVVELRTDWFNRASQRAIERLGARRDGVLRNHSIMADGRVRDAVVYSITDADWPGVKRNLEFLLSRHG
jgi:N-acetyltransferase